MSRVGRVGKRSDPSNDGERKASHVAPVLIGQAQFCGSPQTLLSQMKALYDLGVDVVDLAVPTGLMIQAQVLRSLDLLAKEVLPRIHDFRKGALP